MVFIIDVIKRFLKKEQPIERELTPQQKKKYRKQYNKTMGTTFLVFFPIIYGLGETIYQFLKTGKFIDLALAVLFVLAIETIAERTKNQIELIEERIEKREKKNKKQEQRK